jgi:hypothetical protein
MRLFLDTSVLIAASESTRGASREIFGRALENGWLLVATPYVVEEVSRNLPRFSMQASADWLQLRQQLLILDDVLTLDRAAVFEAAKDRPILFGALAWADRLSYYSRPRRFWWHDRRRILRSFCPDTGPVPRTGANRRRPAIKRNSALPKDSFLNRADGHKSFGHTP